MEFEQRDNRPVSEADIQAIQTRFGFTRTFAALLLRRNLADDASIRACLHPEQEPLPDPYALSDMDRAVQCIRSAIERKECICIYGDYDTDGVCATAILYDAIHRLTENVTYLLPDRHVEGYGLHISAVDRMYADGVQLILTVDNGISAHAEVAYAASRGMDVVITDHHRCHETLPDAAAVVCATRKDQPEFLSCLCGASVAMLLACALGHEAARYLGIAALATMADVVPLEPINRTIVKKGLPMVGLHPGLSALLDAAGIDGAVTDSMLSFILAPRINAAGRMGDATRAVRLLLSANAEERRLLATELEQENVRRRAEEQRILTEAIEHIDDPNAPILILKGKDWNSGVIGIVASRILERYHCPVLLFTEVNGQLIGSGRSVPSVDLFALLTRHADRFSRYGGHMLAAGAALPPDGFAEMKADLILDLAKRFSDGLPEEPKLYEDRLPLSALTPAFAKELASLSPFGEGNREPQFLLEGKLSGVRLLGRDGAHVGATLSEGATSVRLVAFGAGARYADWSALQAVQALVTVSLNSFRGKTDVSIRTEALRAATDPDTRKALLCCMDAIRKQRPLPDESVLKRLPKVTEEEIRSIYRRLKPRLVSGIPFDDLYKTECAALLPLYEIGVVTVENGVFRSEIVQEKKQIQNALLYRALCLE